MGLVTYSLFTLPTSWLPKQGLAVEGYQVYMLTINVMAIVVVGNIVVLGDNIICVS